jgi:P-type E1-E2 ATPase
VAHPLARAIVRAARRRTAGAISATGRRVVPGLGVTGTIDGVWLGAGSPRFARDHVGVSWQAPERAGTPIVLVARDRWLGTIWLGERVRSDAAAAVGALRDAGYAVGVVTGDGSAAAVVPLLVAASEARTALRPEQKVAAIRERSADGLVVMVGDGLNDAPALAAADVGIAVGAPSDLTRTTADVLVFGAAGLTHVVELLAHARRVRRIVVGNLLWAFGYNAIAVIVAAAGRLDPLIAALAMIGSSVVVLANAQRAGAPRGSVGGGVTRGREAAADQLEQRGDHGADGDEGAQIADRVPPIATAEAIRAEGEGATIRQASGQVEDRIAPHGHDQPPRQHAQLGRG